TATSQLCHCLSGVAAVRSSKREALYVGLTVGVLLSAIVGPLLVQLIAGPGLPALTPSRYGSSVVLFIVSSLIVIAMLGDRVTRSGSRRRLMVGWFILVPSAMLRVIHAPLQKCRPI